jgi:large subunit ribosomal protein L6
MSRIAKKPVDIPSGVEVKLGEGNVVVKGPKGVLEMEVHGGFEMRQEDNQILFDPKRAGVHAMIGTIRSKLSNMVAGVSKGFEKKLDLVGIGYRAQLKGKTLNLTLGYSHPIDYAIPEGITISTPSQNQIVIQGIDKQKVGQVAAEIRSFRPPEPYKGKGVKYADEHIIRKETKKT